MFSYKPVNNHEDLLAVVDGLLQEAGLDRKDLGGTNNVCRDGSYPSDPHQGGLWRLRP